MSQSSGLRLRRILSVVDGYSLKLQFDALGREMQLSKLFNFCYQRGKQVTRPIYCIGETSGNGYSIGNAGFLSAVVRTGFELITRKCVEHPVRCPICRRELGNCPYQDCKKPLRRLKGDFDADIAGEICRYVYSKQVNYVLLFATDGDFTRILETVRRDQGVEIEIVGVTPGYLNSHSGCQMNRGLFASADYSTPLESVVDDLALSS